MGAPAINPGSCLASRDGVPRAGGGGLDPRTHFGPLGLASTSGAVAGGLTVLPRDRTAFLARARVREPSGAANSRRARRRATGRWGGCFNRTGLATEATSPSAGRSFVRRSCRAATVPTSSVRAGSKDPTLVGIARGSSTTSTAPVFSRCFGAPSLRAVGWLVAASPSLADRRTGAIGDWPADQPPGPAGLV